MIVQTSRFGPVDIDADRIITFGAGILGFPKYSHYVLIQPEADSTFYWLQSIEAADLAFVVTDPLLFVPGLPVPLREERAQDLGLADLSGSKRSGDREQSWRHADRQPPGSAGHPATTRAAAQVVISEKKYQTRSDSATAEGGCGTCREDASGTGGLTTVCEQVSLNIGERVPRETSTFVLCKSEYRLMPHGGGQSHRPGRHESQDEIWPRQEDREISGSAGLTLLPQLVVGKEC